MTFPTINQNKIVLPIITIELLYFVKVVAQQKIQLYHLFCINVSKLCMVRISIFLFERVFVFTIQTQSVCPLPFYRGHGGRVVTLSPPTSEAGVRFPARPQVGKLVVACRWSAVYSTEP